MSNKDLMKQVEDMKKEKDQNKRQLNMQNLMDIRTTMRKNTGESVVEALKDDRLAKESDFAGEKRS